MGFKEFYDKKNEIDMIGPIDFKSKKDLDVLKEVELYEDDVDNNSWADPNTRGFYRDFNPKTGNHELHRMKTSAQLVHRGHTNNAIKTTIDLKNSPAAKLNNPLYSLTHSKRTLSSPIPDSLAQKEKEDTQPENKNQKNSNPHDSKTIDNEEKEIRTTGDFGNQTVYIKNLRPLPHGLWPQKSDGPFFYIWYDPQVLTNYKNWIKIRSNKTNMVKCVSATIKWLNERYIGTVDGVVKTEKDELLKYEKNLEALEKLKMIATANLKQMIAFQNSKEGEEYDRQNADGGSKIRKALKLVSGLSSALGVTDFIKSLPGEIAGSMKDADPSFLTKRREGFAALYRMTFGKTSILLKNDRFKNVQELQMFLIEPIEEVLKNALAYGEIFDIIGRNLGKRLMSWFKEMYSFIDNEYIGGLVDNIRTQAQENRFRKSMTIFKSSLNRITRNIEYDFKSDGDLVVPYKTLELEFKPEVGKIVVFGKASGNGAKPRFWTYGVMDEITSKEQEEAARKTPDTAKKLDYPLLYLLVDLLKKASERSSVFRKLELNELDLLSFKNKGVVTKSNYELGLIGGYEKLKTDEDDVEGRRIEGRFGFQYYSSFSELDDAGTISSAQIVVDDTENINENKVSFKTFLREVNIDEPDDIEDPPEETNMSDEEIDKLYSTMDKELSDNKGKNKDSDKTSSNTNKTEKSVVKDIYVPTGHRYGTIIFMFYYKPEIVK